MDLMIPLLDPYKYFEGIFWSVLLEKPFLWISVYLLLFILNQFAYTKGKKPIKCKDGSQSNRTHINNS